jgi:hypothetical protein
MKNEQKAGSNEQRKGRGGGYQQVTLTPTEYVLYFDKNSHVDQEQQM